MESIKINYTKPIIRKEVIQYKNIYEDEQYFYIVVSGLYKIRVGETINLSRFVYSESRNTIGVEDVTRKVISVSYKKNSKGKVLATLIKTNKIGKKILNVSNVEFINENNANQYLITFDNKINIFAQDILYAKKLGIDTTIQALDTENNEYQDIIFNLNMVETNNISGRSNNEYIVKYNQEPDKFVFNWWNSVDYNDCEGSSTNPNHEPMYYYLPNKGSNYSIFGDIVYGFMQDDLFEHTIVYKHNSFFCYEEEKTIISEFPEISAYKCHLWKDIDSVTIDNIVYNRDIYDDAFNQKYNTVKLVKETGIYNIPIGLTNVVDYVHMSQEDNINTVFAEKVKEAVVEQAPVIDMEKVKYAPYYYKDGVYMPITSITYNLHFRTRNLSEDGWQYVDDSAQFWNSGTTPSNLIDNNNSDMLYYLGYTDYDVQNQKLNLGKSFIRLSFYDSTDLVTQKLLYYSTIFFDTGSLFGKYIKAKTQLASSGLSTDNVVLESYLTDYRLDSAFTVRDEYYTQKSSDGFNIYYFPDVVLDGENNERTIYMKVEFNHARYGRTIPMIVWPVPQSTISFNDAKENLFIPIKLKYLTKEESINKEKVYTYLFDFNELITLNDNTITLNLVEPKLG